MAACCVLMGKQFLSDEDCSVISINKLKKSICFGCLTNDNDIYVFFIIPLRDKNSLIFAGYFSVNI